MPERTISSPNKGPRNRPDQAVILAGGRGTRLRPLTDHTPKPMIQFHGKPFLEYLIEMLRDEGFGRILILLGYMPDAIEGYFGTGKKWGVEITYSVSPVENETGRRVKLAEPLLDDIFLLMYCDNYWPIRIDDMWQHFSSSDADAMLTVYKNTDGYSVDNTKINNEGFIEIYDKSRSLPGLLGVEIGYAIITKAVLELLPTENVSFEQATYPTLANNSKLLAYTTSHRYYSVGSHNRLPLTNEFLGRRASIFIDRDGVLNQKPPRAQYVVSWDKFQWLPGAKQALALLSQAGYRIMVVSNQAGIARGAMTELALSDIHEGMKAETLKAGGKIDAVYYCPHDWDENCVCRKPQPGMLLKAQQDYHLDLTRTPFIGDDERDGEAANAVGSPFMMVSKDMSLLDHVTELVGNDITG